MSWWPQRFGTQSPSVPERLLGKQARWPQRCLRGGEAGGKVATTSGLSRVVCPSLRRLGLAASDQDVRDSAPCAPSHDTPNAPPPTSNQPPTSLCHPTNPPANQQSNQATNQASNQATNPQKGCSPLCSISSAPIEPLDHWHFSCTIARCGPLAPHQPRWLMRLTDPQSTEQPGKTTPHGVLNDLLDL